MTADVELLPPPSVLLNWPHPTNHVAMRDYARANVAHATAPLQAEIEALRAEVERANGWNKRVSVCRDHVADIVDGPCVICALDAAEARAERLAEALRELLSAADDFMAYSHYEDEIGYRPCCGVLPYKPHEDGCAVTEAQAVLRDHDQEVSNG